MPARPASVRASRLSFAVNLLLLVAKGLVAWYSGSVAVLSEALNSLLDTVGAVITWVGVRVAARDPDHGHPFGHHRAEPLAGLVTAILTGVLAFEAIQIAIERVVAGGRELQGTGPIAVLVATIGVKSLLSHHLIRVGTRHRSPSLRAAGIDSRNDVLVASLALAGVAMATAGQTLFDPTAGALVGVYVLYSGYRIARENIDYLMGGRPDEVLITQVREKALLVPGVLEVLEVRGHYVGHYVHVEVTIAVDGRLETTESHVLSERAREQIESLDDVSRAFIHVEPREVAGA